MPEADTQHILIAGYYGSGNTGDEAILAAIQQELRAVAPDVRLIVVSDDPSETAARYGVEAFAWSDHAARLEAIERSRLVIIGGGGLFHDYWGVPEVIFAPGTWGMALYLEFGLFAAMRGVPVMLWAVGVGPLRTAHGKHVMRWLCRLANAISVRDAYSASELVALGVAEERIEVTADPVFSTTPAPLKSDRVREIVGHAATGHSPLVGVCIRHWDYRIDPTVWEAQVADALDRLAAATGASFLFIPFQSRDPVGLNDAAAGGRIRAAMRAEARVTMVPQILAVEETWALIDECDCLLAMRFHAGVAAATQGVPFVSLSYDPKVTALTDSLGLSDLKVDIGSVKAEELARLLEMSLARREELRERLQKASRQLGVRASRNAALAAVLLAGDGSAGTPEDRFENFGDLLANTLKNQVRLWTGAELRLLQERQRTENPVAITVTPPTYEPLITVVLPVWNHKRFIAGAIRSVLAQTWRNLELIVINDGSDEDLTPELREAIGEDPRALVVRKEHEGLPQAVNAGFRHARGEFFTWTSADNFMKPDMLALLASFLLRHPDVAMVYGDMDLIDSDGNPLLNSNYRIGAQRPGATNELRLPHEVETLGLAQDNYIGACFLYRADTARLVGDYDGSRLGVEDYDYWLRMSAVGQLAHVDCERCLYSYRVHADSIGGRHGAEIVPQAINLIEKQHRRRLFDEQPLEIAVVADPACPGLGRTADNLAAALRRMRHQVAKIDFEQAEQAMPAWSETAARPVLLWFGEARAWLKEFRSGHPGLVCFHWLSAASRGEAVAHGLFSSSRVGAGPLLPASQFLFEDLLLCLKARGTAYPMWGLTEFERPLFVYLGPVSETCIDWAAVESLVAENAGATILFVPTEAGYGYDPRERLPSVTLLGPRLPADWYPYLSRADLLIAPFSDVAGVEDFVSDVLTSYLAAGKPILATPATRLSGFGAAPNIWFAAACDFGASALQARRMEPHIAVADAWIASKSPGAFAAAISGAAANELFAWPLVRG